MNHGNCRGNFVISLDFELMWGVRDVADIYSYGSNILNVHNVIPSILEIFEKNNTRVTFASVGFLFHKNIGELMKALPDLLPQYKDANLSPFNEYLKFVNEVELNDKLHFAPDLIFKIEKSGLHEIATHTYSHFYCRAIGSTKDAFKSDISKAVSVAALNSIRINSIVLPRNQIDLDCLRCCSDLGIICYRGSQRHWVYSTELNRINQIPGRIIRFLDAYINITGYNCHRIFRDESCDLINIPASSFLRPFKQCLQFLDNLKLRRIKNAMTFAAKNGLTYHLWWHPHNFGDNTPKNLFFLSEILKHYKQLEVKYKFRSITMGDLANEYINEGS